MGGSVTWGKCSESKMFGSLVVRVSSVAWSAVQGLGRPRKKNSFGLGTRFLPLKFSEVLSGWLSYLGKMFRVENVW